MIYNDAVKELSELTGLPEKLIENTYKAYWKVIKEHLESLPLKSDMSKEDFCALKTRLNIPSIGKLTAPFNRYEKQRQVYKNLTQN